MKQIETGCVIRSGDDTDDGKKIKEWSIPGMNGNTKVQAKTFQEAIEIFRLL